MRSLTKNQFRMLHKSYRRIEGFANFSIVIYWALTFCFPQCARRINGCSRPPRKIVIAVSSAFKVPKNFNTRSTLTIT